MDTFRETKKNYMKFKCFSILISALFSCSYLYAAGNFAVGTLQGEFNVSPTGAATYEIPIECPTGVGGLKPELKFVYNSQMTTDGLMGCGWTIGGLSSIARTFKSVEYDGSTSGVEYTLDDALTLDGMRLIKVGASADHTEFRMEHDIYTRIEGYEPQPQGFRYFKVYTKDGRTLTFGKAEGDGGGIAWPLTEICDANGNYITIDGITSYGGDMNGGIGWVRYGKNKSGAGYEIVMEFEFESTPNASTLYISGKSIDRWARLSRVRILGNGFVSTGEYKLRYKDGILLSDRSRLESISYSRDGVKLNSTNFTWLDSHYGIKNIKTPDKNSESKWKRIKGLSYGDYTGDGVTDRAMILGDEVIIGRGVNGPADYDKDVEGVSSLMLYDIDHDGVSEVVMGVKSGDRIDHIVGKWDKSTSSFVWKSLDEYSVGRSTRTNLNEPIPILAPANIPYTELSGDFYGDGTLQFVPARSGKVEYLFPLILKIGGDNDNAYRTVSHKASGNFPDTRNLPQEESQVYSVNVNGNNKSDLMFVSKGGDISFYEEKNGVFTEIMHNDLKVSKKDAVYPCDINGDGCTDLMILRNSGNTCTAELYLSTGTGFVRSEAGSRLSLGAGAAISFVDVNSDGRQDVVTYDSHNVNLYVSTGRSFKQVATARNTTPDLTYYPVISGVSPTKGGKKQYVEYMDGMLELTPDSIFDKVVKIEDGLQNTISLSYENEENAGTVVKSVKKLNSAGVGLTNVYAYNGALYGASHKFAGYSSVKSTEEMSGKETVESYTLKKSVLQHDRTYESVGGVKTKETTYSYDVVNLGGTKLYSLVLAKQTERNNTNNLEQSVEYHDFDSNGNPHRIIIKHGGQTVTHDISYVSFAQTDMTKQSNIKSTYSYEGAKQVKERGFKYDERGNLTERNEDGATVRYSDYDVFGNYRTVTYGSGSEVRTEKYVYTESGRYVKNKYNVLGERTVYVWDGVQDQLQYEVDAYKRFTYYYYNALGEVTSTFKPGINTVKTEKYWAEPGNPYGASYYTVETSYKDGTTTIWFTSDGREVCRQSHVTGGKKVYVTRQYNADGTLSRVSKPSFSPVPEEWAEIYTYDEFSRPVNVSRPDGDAKLSYSGRSSTLQTPGEKVVRTLTAEGWTESVTTNGKTVRYRYYPDGSIKSSTPDGGEPVYMEYDKQGNRTLISDADGGTVKKKYNEFGDLTESSRRQGSGSTVTTTYTYSPVGLLKQKNCGGNITNYEYDSRNRLVQKTMGAGVSQSYEYDNADRIVKTTDRIDGKVFVRKTEYNGSGNKKRETYPSGYYVDYEYDENEKLSLVKDMDGNEIYRPLEATASGLIKKESRGGVITNYVYGSADRLEQKVSDGIIFQMYNYDSKGNLAKYEDGITGQSFFYAYDDQNRLVKWDVRKSGEAVFSDSIAYDDSNNMVSRGSFGDCIMAYDDASHPHAISSISSISGVPVSFPRTDQNITYTNFGKVESVTEGDMRYDITYNADEQRIKSEYTSGRGKTTRYYAGDYEEVTSPDGSVTKYHYLAGGAMMIEKGGERKLYYTYTDRLGSVLAVTDAYGAVIENYAYDPWGNRLDPYDWSKEDDRENLLCNRGFTGHEHIDGMNLINMNGRVYDPLIGLFLSLDPYIQAPDFWLNYNRYLYGYGNPLKYVDPSGESILLAVVIGAIVGAVVGGTMGYMYGYINGASGWDLVKYVCVGMLTGGVVGALCGLGGVGIIAAATHITSSLLLATTAVTACIYVTAGLVGTIMVTGGCFLDLYLTNLLGGLWAPKAPTQTNQTQTTPETKPKPKTAASFIEF